jgi:hypothetical protein
MRCSSGMRLFHYQADPLLDGINGNELPIQSPYLTAELF